MEVNYIFHHSNLLESVNEAGDSLYVDCIRTPSYPDARGANLKYISGILTMLTKLLSSCGEQLTGTLGQQFNSIKY
jgi:hypothetical protein